MGLIADYHEAFEAGNEEQMAVILHDDCLFIPHVGNAQMTKQDMLGICLLYTSPSPRDS